MAVLTGLAVDLLITTVVYVAAGPTADALRDAPDPSRPEHLLLMTLGALATGVGGYLAGRIARTSYALNGLMVGVVGVLFTQLPNLGGLAVPGMHVVASLVGCALGATGGLLARMLHSKS
jgi:hypothetical protein